MSRTLTRRQHAIKREAKTVKAQDAANILSLEYPPGCTGRKRINAMSEYNKFLENVYSDELISVNPDEFDDVQRLMADEGYQEFSIELEQELTEQEAWIGSEQVSGILIKKQCEHTRCPHTRCQREVRLGGIAI